MMFTSTLILCLLDDSNETVSSLSFIPSAVNSWAFLDTYRAENNFTVRSNIYCTFLQVFKINIHLSYD